MFLKFSPLSFLFMFVYFLTLFMLFMMDSFISIWILMEASTFMFLGILFSYMNNNFYNMLVMFIIQSVASLMMMIFYLISCPFLLFMFFILKMAMFPFMNWFFSCCMYIDSFFFMFISIFQKIPSIFLFNYIDFSSSYMSTFLWFSIFMTMVVSSYYSLHILDLRSIMIVSSISNNSWLLLSCLMNLYVPLIYLAFYSFSLYFILDLSKHSRLNSLNFYSKNPSLFKFFFVSISGLPPFPMFFIKLYVLYSSLLMYSNWGFLMILMFLSLFMIYSQCKFLMSSFVNSYSSLLHLLLIFNNKK